ncbi:AAA family ATPase [Halpernia sp.]|uniref:AAA family ATPase n=1 Tax=Halpernia sp. TaxID=2782209 RepID=UPI003A8DE285
MNLTEIAQKLSISVQAIKKFIEDFRLNIDECFTNDFQLQPEFEKFIIENKEFLKKYEEDLNIKKSAQEISEKINKPTEKISEILENNQAKIYDNGIYKSSVSSFSIDNQLGGNYQFVYKYFDQSNKLCHRDFIGYRDLFFYISDALETFINKVETENWGIQKPAGIILYGPPGCGKIFWAKKIAEITDYHFKELKQHYLGATFVDGSRESFNQFLISIMKQDHTLLFLENFNEIMETRTSADAMNCEDEETKEIVLHYINKFEQEGVLMVGSANFLEGIDSEILAPGRFDILIPVFPPNAEERAELLLYHMTKGLKDDSILLEILKENKADFVPFWLEISGKMKAFSNTMLIDFTQSLKKKIRKQFNKNKSDKKMSEDLLNNALREASAKLTPDYLEKVDQFLQDMKKNNYDDFPVRISTLSQELETYKIQPIIDNPIGFQHNAENF